MKSYFFSIILLFITISTAVANNDNNESLGRRLMPHYFSMQYAGSVGAASLGTGWTYGRKNQWESGFSVGFVPKSAYDKVMTVIAVKQSYVPWDIEICKSNFSISPLVCGLFISSVLDSNFWLKEPEKYDPPYYGYPTKVRVNLHMGQRATYRPTREVLKIKAISPYYEFSISDYNLINTLGNSYFRPRDILSLAFGVILFFK